ncbi:polysaccharide biosynthesis protein [Lactiplantibacillus fabifermentans T30PCM01]|uniref:Polysaccharide biosynthesis protein n=1 Tax=Lactiplantibacillus fabifermentans T30PCM01 TaxID=1400520 RepID=W6TB68_9LACO|nr:polysaccharide biosynthesis protein [Lactiplantibacillus fabifermentans T30PCM01]
MESAKIEYYIIELVIVTNTWVGEFLKNKMLSGTFWMSFGSIFSRVLGVVYLIPWLMMLGSQQHQMTAQAMFNAAYTPYALFLSLGTSGFPTAISRKIAGYNAENRYLDSQHLFKAGLLFMSISGLICGSLLFVFAPAIAKSSPVTSYQATTLVIRFLTPALFILPVMSIIRGYFQGNQDMKPFGISQLIEQFVRVIGILGASYVSFIVLKQSLTMAVGLSTFATFFGAIASLLYLGYYYQQRRPQYQAQLSQSAPATKMNLKADFMTIIKEAIPFVFVGAGITLSQLVDQFTFKQIMLHVTTQSATAIQNLFTLFSANPNKITTVIISLALAVSETTLPILASVQGDRTKVTKVIVNNFKMLFGLIAPMIIILALLAPQINTVFFGFDQQGGQLMRWAIIVSLPLAVFTDVFTLIQALGQHRRAVTLLVVVLAIKALAQYPLVLLFHANGALLATFIAFASISVAGTVYLLKACDIKLKSKNSDVTTMFAAVLQFLVVAVVVYILGDRLFPVSDRVLAFIFAAVEGVMMLGAFGLFGSFYSMPSIALNLKIGRQYKQYKHFR